MILLGRYIVTVNYDTKVVTGSGTTFGETGAAKVGDVIRFGVRGNGGTYFGDNLPSLVLHQQSH